jgi:hypothetical protein
MNDKKLEGIKGITDETAAILEEHARQLREYG